jgi:hypothetical protein
MVAIVMGEVTSPLQNVWFILKNLRYDFQWADSIFKPLSWIYAVFYVLCRTVVGPVVVCSVLQHLPACLPAAGGRDWMACLKQHILGSIF